MKRTLILSILSIATLAAAYPQIDGLGVRTNLLPWALGSPALGIDLAWNSRYMVVVDGNYGDWNVGSQSKRLRHSSAGLELRRYFSDGTPMWANPHGDRYRGLYLGIDGRFTRLHNTLRRTRCDGEYLTAGLVVGYTFRLRGGWAVDAGIGGGYVHKDEKKYTWYPPAGANRATDEVKKSTVGLTSLSVSLLYRFNL